MNEDLSSLFEKFNINKDNISPDMVQNLLGMLNNSSNNNDTNTQSPSSAESSSGFDFDTFMRMKSIIDKMNIKDDPRSNLLQSLKPYLKESRQGKVDQYIQLMNLSKVMDVFPFMGGDKKNV